MSDLFIEISKNSTNNKNVSTLIVEYLTDPPVLPFLDELNKNTKVVKFYTTLCWFYSLYYIDSNFEKRHWRSSIIRYGDGTWSI